MPRKFATLRYGVTGRIARVTLNRPARLNAVDERMPGEIRRAARGGERGRPSASERTVRRGGALCAGYDLERFVEGGPEGCSTQPMPWDPMRD
ncbi:MAG: hypothetical protein RML56_08025 [Burkholderiales bacterium]|nr:hypothetical protein [Burkholderiales bacterium]